MEGIKIGDGWEFPNTPSSEIRTVVLVGKTGNGKSATGNSILRTKAFTSMRSAEGVTSTCEMRRTLLEDGKILNVIDTPGLCDSSLEPESIGKEIVQSINMAKDGIHAILVVVSVRFRFSRDEIDAVESLKKLFGTKISDYMIIVFTGGDELEEDGVTLNDYLRRDCPLKEIVKMCGNRCVLFDNKTKDESKKNEQLKELVSLVSVVVETNGGKPYTNNELFVEVKKGAVELCHQTVEINSKEGCSKQEISQLQEQFHKSHEEQLNKITEMDIEHGFNEQFHTPFGEKLKRIAAFVFYAVLLFYFFESNEGRAAEEKST